jgi:hypothetical protein
MCHWYLISCSFFAIVYLKIRDRTQEQIFSRILLTMWMVGIPSCMACAAVYVYNEDLVLLQKGVKDGMMRPGAYLITRLIIEIPALLMLSMCALLIPAYGIGAFHVDNIGAVVVAHALIMWNFEAFAQLSAVQFDHPLKGLMQFMQTWFASFLFMGVMVAEEDVIWPFRILCSIMPLKWGFRLLLWSEISDAEFDGTVRPPPAYGCGWR